VKTLKELLSEGKNKSTTLKDPPNVLIMKRVSIRNFNNGQRVALYHIQKLNKYVSIPYGRGKEDDEIIVPHEE